MVAWILVGNQWSERLELWHFRTLSAYQIISMYTRKASKHLNCWTLSPSFFLDHPTVHFLMPWRWQQEFQNVFFRSMQSMADVVLLRISVGSSPSLQLGAKSPTFALHVLSNVWPQDGTAIRRSILPIVLTFMSFNLPSANRQDFATSIMELKPRMHPKRPETAGHVAPAP